MPRAVSQGQVMFNECIEEFRHSVEQRYEPYDDISTCYLLTDFTLDNEWHLPNIKIDESRKIELANAQAAFVSQVHISDKCSHRTVHLYVTALASIMTFATGRRVVGPRDRYYSRPRSGEEHLLELALLHPILTAGPGYVDPFISRETFDTFTTSTEKLITKLRSIPYKKYIIAMQAIRLVDLSIINKRQDFGLAYFLIVGAIEAVAQKVKDIKPAKTEHPQKGKWDEMAKGDNECAKLFANLLAEFEKVINNQSSIRETYTNFIYKFAPPEIWKTLLPHPSQSHLNNLEGITNPDGSTFSSVRLWHEVIPEDLTGEQIRQAISSSYKHRCDFVHCGGQPPHGEATAYSHFFQEIQKYNVHGHSTTLVPNYELLVGIARHSIMRWIDELADAKT